MKVITKGKVYKVWIEIEEYDIEAEEGVTVDALSFPCTATFRTADQAVNFAARLHTVADSIKARRIQHP